MFVALTGTPGTGKTSVSKLLSDKGYFVVSITEIAENKDFILEFDQERQSKILDTDKINKYIKSEYSEKNLVIIEGHLSHLLKCCEKVILLRAHPKKLVKNLDKKNWKKEKIKENLQAEALDIILCEITEVHKSEDIFEIDTTNLEIVQVCEEITKIIENNFKIMKKYKIGKIDWSEEIIGGF
jgi:adenylate kinase